MTLKDRIQTAPDGSPADDNGQRPPRRYFIDYEQASERPLSLALVIASRRCYVCRQADEEEPSASSDLTPYLERIIEHCTLTSDYLPADTPLKEAMFRVLLANGNEPMTAEEISLVLSGKWEMTPYPRDLSSRVIERLLDHSENYCIAHLPEPVPEEQELSAEPPTEALVEQELQEESPGAGQEEQEGPEESPSDAPSEDAPTDSP